MRSLEKTILFKVSPKEPDKRKMVLSAKVLRNGGLVAFPTETVYGIAANLLDKKAISRLYKVKNRHRGKPFTVHIANKAAIKKLGCKITKEAEILIDRFWPGPLTIILKSKNGKRIGFRMPDNKIALELIKKSKTPIVAPSANLSGEKPPTTAKDVLKDLDGKIDILLDAGKTDVGIESTVIDMSVKPPKILREGAIKRKAILGVLK